MIDLLTPSYNRPERLATMYKSAKDTAALPSDVTVWVAIELDDPHFHDYKKGLHYDLRVGGTWGYAAPAWNALAEVSWGYIVHMCADDLIFKTKDWDLLVRDHFCEQPLKVLHYRDDLRDEKMALNPFVTRDFIRRVGYVHPKLKHFYADTYIEDIARRAGVLHYDPAIHIQQAHWKNSLAPWDATYARTRGNNTHAEDAAVWAETENERKDLAKALTAT